MALLAHVLSVLCVAVSFASGQDAVADTIAILGCEFGGTVFKDNTILREKCLTIQCLKGTWTVTSSISDCCVFGEELFENDAILSDACITMKCKHGDWEYTGKSDNCEICTVDVDLHIKTFQNLLGPEPSGYPHVQQYLLNNNVTGEYVFTRPGFSSPLFGVNANLENCEYSPNVAGMCIDSITYFEPGINVTLVLPIASQAASCVTSDGTPTDHPDCDIQVLVNDNRIVLDGSTVKGVSGEVSGPTILVFRNTGIGEANNLNCIDIVGTEGLSVSLCDIFENYPFFKIWTMPTIKADPSELHGLCNIFNTPGHTTGTLWLGDGTKMQSYDCLTEIPNEKDAFEICDKFSQSWKLPISN